MDFTSTIVIDNGEGTSKAGYCGDETPRSVFPTIVGRPHGLATSGYVGDDAIERNRTLQFTRPIQFGTVDSWEDIEQVWHYIFYNELRISPPEHPVLLTEPLLSTKLDREKMVEIMFEQFGVPATYIGVQAVLGLYAAGKTTGLVLDSGEGMTRMVPIYEGHPLLHSITRMDFAGKDLTQFLVKTLQEKDVCLTSIEEKEIVRDMKERHCYVALDFEQEMEKAASESSVNYELPDGTIVTLDNQRFRVPEALFKPSLIGIESKGVHELVANAIDNSDLHLTKDLYSTIVLSGGSTLFPNINDRLTREIQQIAPPRVTVEITAPSERRYASWLGGSILASLTAFESICISKEDYNSAGPSVIHKKHY